MRSAVRDFVKFPDGQLFDAISEGIGHIVQNSTSLDESAKRLHESAEYRTSEIIRALAEEEAAKVLVLLDFVRCPKKSMNRGAVLKCFYSHIGKRVYAMSASYPRIATFSELCNLVQMEDRSYYLDGPNMVDWIYPNSITAEREGNMYVDYVQDITEENGQYYWTFPVQQPATQLSYEIPDCVRLSQALSTVGACSPDGLAIIADVWRNFEPQPDTNRKELRKLIASTLDRLAHCASDSFESAAASFIVWHWSFPLWPLKIDDARESNVDLRALRQARKQTIERIERRVKPKPIAIRSRRFPE